MDGILIYEPFNGAFWLLFSVFAVLTAIGTVAARKKGTEFAGKLLGIWCLAIVVYHVIFKIGILLDKEYAVIRIAGGMPEVSIWTELPIQLCDINLLVLPYAVLSKKDVGFIRFFSIVFGIIGAFMAIVLPYPGFTGYSLLIPRVMGYYFTHFSIIFSAAALLTFRLYKPTLKDFRKAGVMLVAAYAFSVVVNIVLRCTGLSEKANYFFSFDPVGMGPLEFFYKLIPIPGLYLVVPIVPLFTAIYFIAVMIKRLRKRNPVN